MLNAAHELKTPLSSILGYAETLAQGAASDPVMRDRFIERIHANARRLGRLVEDLLTLGRIESGRWPIERREVRLREIVGRLFTSLQSEAEGRHVRLVSGLGASDAVRADEFALEQILLNLLDNAIKYNRDGGQVTVSSCRGFSSGGNGTRAGRGGGGPP
ncbi:MAG: hypothetical protein HYY13_06535 [Nitrospirae bacterium]|nr:hypothetical protein [Nitrospirota bacterium]